MKPVYGLGVFVPVALVLDLTGASLLVENAS